MIAISYELYTSCTINVAIAQPLPSARTYSTLTQCELAAPCCFAAIGNHKCYALHKIIRIAAYNCLHPKSTQGLQHTTACIPRTSSYSPSPSRGTRAFLTATCARTAAYDSLRPEIRTGCRQHSQHPQVKAGTAAYNSLPPKDQVN